MLTVVCGIAGWAGVNQRGLSPQHMARALRHRGPDEAGLWQCSAASLAIARLSIIDVENGHQPVHSEDGSVVAVLNGEIYNFRELAKDLEMSGIRVRSGSDAEVIPHLYVKYGLEFVSKLRGMFAIAIWDDSRQRMVLVRDRVGKKPLVYARLGDGLIFSSETRGILAAGWRSGVNLDVIDHVLAFGYTPSDQGAFSDLAFLPPGSIALWQAGKIEVTSYWSWAPVDSKLPVLGLDEQVEGVLDEAVRLRLVSERPLGVFLSGGIDSSIVAALVANHHVGPVKTFAVGFEDPRYDESGFARRVAEFLGTDHTELIVQPDPGVMLDRLSEVFDQPFADPSAIPTLLLSDLASRDVVVVLSGDGGDEGFGGYERYRAAPALQRLNPLLNAVKPIGSHAALLADRAGQRRLGRLAREFQSQPSLGDRYRGIMELIPSHLRRRLWTQEAQRAFSVVSAESSFDEVWRRFDGAHDLDRMRAVDFATYLPGDLLTKVDIASMSCSLEVRSPFLDQMVLALAAQLPHEVLLRRGTSKWILRQLAYRLVPRHLIDRPKRGFGIPQAAWLRGPLREMSRDLLLDKTARQRGWFEPSVVEGLLVAHDSGRDHDRYIWPLLMVEVWARRWLDRY